MAYEESPFNIVHQTDVYEIRHYVDRLAVQATYTNQNSSFRNLFNYISGANIDSEKIKMTTPVTQFEGSSEMVMQFYLPSKFTKKTAPVPTDPRVELITIEEGHYAVIKYSGRLTDKNFNKHKKILKESLIEDKIEIIDRVSHPHALISFNIIYPIEDLKLNSCKVGKSSWEWESTIEPRIQDNFYSPHF